MSTDDKIIKNKVGLLKLAEMRQDLNGYVAAEVLVVGAVDDTHPPGTDLFDDAIVAECTANERVLRQGFLRHSKTLLPSPVLMLGHP